MKRILLFAWFGTLGVLTLVAQSAGSAENVKFTKVSTPVSNQGTQGNRPAGEFYHATYTGAAFGDYNNDGYLDLYYSDRNTLLNDNTVYSNLYRNTQQGQFSRLLRPGIAATAFSCPVWLDMNNDGNLDLFVSGLGDWHYAWNDTVTALDQIKAHLYLGNGEGGFTEVTDCGVRPIYNGLTGGKGHNWVTVGDVDHDGFVDMVMTGFDDVMRPTTARPENAVRVVYLYRNVNGERFELEPTPVEGNSTFQGMNDGSVTLVDLDGDGWLDLFATGYGYSHNAEGYIYWNRGNGTFTAGTALPVWALTNASCSVADLDNDGLPDLVLTGIYTDAERKGFTVCRNNGDRTFTPVSAAALEPIDGGQLAFGDVNQDGWVDMLVGGHGQTHEHSTWLYVNQGNFNFEVNGAHYNDPFGKLGSFSRVTHGSDHLIDYDNDGYLDAWFNGWCNGGCSNGCLTELWHNDCSTKGVVANTAPTAPARVQSAVNIRQGEVTLKWQPGSDDNTPTQALRYNIYVKNLRTNKIFTLVPADLSTGFIKVEALNAAITGQSFTMHIERSEYEWGVQTIDNGNRGSTFTKGYFTTAATSMNQVDKMAVAVFASHRSINYRVDGTAVIRVCDALGSTVTHGSVTGTGSIAVPAPGIYLVTVTQNNRTQTYKLAL
ncbi:MAG: T9SS type A sorting domain-containing protein [Muribaculaceae bacterium]|nr:T9SS type A sorting domain-containing protein [Muribaculaceae bacterium]